MGYEQYVGRNVDLAVYSGPLSAFTQQNLTISDGLVVTGIEKLSQRFVLTLMTSRGSIKFAPERGCDFLPLLRAGAFRTDHDVQSAFSAVVQDIRAQLLAEETETTPDDEKFKDAELVSVTVKPASVVLRVNVISQAGDYRIIILPSDVIV